VWSPSCVKVAPTHAQQQLARPLVCWRHQQHSSHSREQRGMGS
jgi:hypothetical protein